MGIIHPVIILPDIPYTEGELYFVFLHELLYYKHKDFLVKMLTEFLIAIHWWNPVISRFLLPSINQVQELFVDYSVNKTLTSNDKVAYMNVLSKTVKYAFLSKQNT